MKHNISIVIVDCVEPVKASKVLSYCGKLFKVKEKLLFTSEKINSDENRIILIDKINSISEYNKFILKKLHSFIQTEFCLIIQTDGFIINPHRWNKDFLKYDFIGAPISDYPGWLNLQQVDFKIKFKESNFSEFCWPMNGGFSLRSKRLLDLTAQCPYPQEDLPEDVYITNYYRNWFEQKGIKFAPRYIAYTFSKESPLINGNFDFSECFGFHGQISYKHNDLAKLPFKNKSKFACLKKIFHIHTDISLKRYLNITVKKFFNTLSRNDFFDCYSRYYFNEEHLKPDFNVELDLVLTVIEKDLPILPFTIVNARKYILHNIKNIYIVAPEKEVFKTFCKQHNCEYINETKILSIQKQDIHYNFKGKDRSGWLFQQLLKLNSDKFCKSENICILDSDTVLIKPRIYFKTRKNILDFSDEFHLPYFITYEKLTGLKHKIPVSFVCHNMLFEKKKLQKLKKHIEKITHKDFNHAILDCIDENEISCFSEYETYANFVLQNYKSEYKIEYWNNISLKNDFINSLDYFEALYKPSKIKSISFHSYNK